MTWVYGEMPDAAAGVPRSRCGCHRPAMDRRPLELEHVAIVPDEMWDQYGPGAVGVGWDGGVLGLSLHLRGGSVDDPIAWQLSAEGRECPHRSSVAWGAAYEAAGADPAAAATAVANTTAFYAPEPETPS